MIVILKALIDSKGSALSGNRGHSGREGLIGGSISNDPFIASLSPKFDEILQAGHPHQQAHLLRKLAISTKADNPETRAKLKEKIKSIGSQISKNYYNLAESRFNEIVNSNEPVATKLALLSVEQTWPTNPLDLQNLDFTESVKIGELYTKTFNDLSKQELDSGLPSVNDEISGEFAIIGNTTKIGNQALANILKDAYNPENQRAIDFYFEKGDSIVNHTARTGSLPYDNPANRGKLSKTLGRDINVVDHESVQEVMNIMDNACTDRLPRSMVLTRRVGKGHPIYDALNEGKDLVDSVYTEKNFSSTSINYSSSFGKKDYVNIRIKAPQGTRGLSFFGVKYMGTEYEFMLPRNSTFKVAGYNRNTNEVIVEIIGE